MSAPNDGGPAFPCPSYASNGMSLRDWFAGQAIGAVIPHLILTMQTKFTETQMATLAFVIADAMLSERSKP